MLNKRTKAAAVIAVSAAVVGSPLLSPNCPRAGILPSSPQVAEAAVKGLPKAGYWKWSEKEAPNYVKKIGKAQVSKKLKAGKVKYSKLDSRGRTRSAYAKVTYKMVKASAGHREEFAPGSDPSGWGHNKTVTISLSIGRNYKGWMWNRSHLIADSLGGKAIRRNLVTGTRTQNVGANDGRGGMAYCETKVRNWLWVHHKGTVYYAVTPVYKGSEVVPRNVVVNMKSSDGKINERVVVYNCAKGFKINYSTGKAVAVKKSSSKKAAPKKSVYITQTGSCYHNAGCATTSRSRNVSKVTVSYAKRIGLKPCRVCGS